MGVISDFSDNFLNNVIGVITGTYASSQFPDIPCNLARFHARSGNPGSIFIATAPNQLFGWELDAGNDTGWFPATNLNQFYQSRASGTSDMLDYWIQR